MLLGLKAGTCDPIASLVGVLSLLTVTAMNPTTPLKADETYGDTFGVEGGFDFAFL
jgi:hypothetical protein